MTVAALIPFFLMASAFFAYDWFVNRRNGKVLAAAIDNGRIVSSLFPKNVRARLIAENKAQEEQAAQQDEPWTASNNKMKLQQFLVESDPTNNAEQDEDWMYSTKPIADFFPETTVMVRILT